MADSILYINHKYAQCGVYEFGKNIGSVLQNATKYDFLYIECGNAGELHEAISKYQPIIIFYNYHPSTLPWINSTVTKKINIPQIGFIHEVTQELADKANSKIFNYHVAADPTLILKNPIVFKTGRLVPRFTEVVDKQGSIPIFGSFGFAVGNKGFDFIVSKIQNEYDEAVIRLNIPSATFGDKEGSLAKKLEEKCRLLINKPGIKMEITHQYWSQKELLNFLAQNTLNLFYNDPIRKRGIASSLDFAIAAKKPFAVNESSMFRHILIDYGNVNLEKYSLKSIIDFGTDHIERLYREWSPENLVWEYERVVDKIKENEHKKQQFQQQQTVGDKLKRTVKKLLGFKTGYYNELYSWTSNIHSNKTDLSPVFDKNYTPVTLPLSAALNRILDNEARQLYKPAIDMIQQLVPEWFNRKIAAANVQQGFVLDTVIRLSQQLNIPRILSIGCFEDTAYGALKRLRYDISGIDPVVNYELSEYITHPSASANSYDILFSTSVIEHVEEDEQFMQQMSWLLKSGGYIILTCDFKEGYKDGDLKPKVDFRLYSKEDILSRLLNATPELELIDEPQWACPNPDFSFDGIQYTFASIVLRKK